MKILHEKIQQSQNDKSLAFVLCEWIQENKIVQKFLNLNTHPQILNKLPRILRFLYDYQQLPLDDIFKIIKNSLKAQD